MLQDSYLFSEFRSVSHLIKHFLAMLNASTEDDAISVSYKNVINTLLTAFAVSTMAACDRSGTGVDPKPGGNTDIKTETFISAPAQSLIIKTDSTCELVNSGIIQAYRIGLSLKLNAVGVKGSMTYEGGGAADVKDIRAAGVDVAQMVYFNSPNHIYQIKRADDTALFTADDKSIAYKSFKSTTLIFQEATVEGAKDPEEARKWVELWTKNADKVTITSKSNGVADKATLNDKIFTLNAQ